MNKLPKSRNKNIIVQNVSDEILVYDMNTNQAFCLNETSTKVYNACDGQTSFDELKSKYKFTDDLINLALDEFQKKGLLEKESSYQSPFAGMNRRKVIFQVGLATLNVLPLISSLVAPQAVHALSGACSPNAVGCFSPGVNTNLGDGNNCSAQCSSFAPSCCSCAIGFSLPNGAGQCYCSCQ